ncbi:MAG: SOS response-associated peptidase family protein [Pseudomonadota bacterium]
MCYSAQIKADYLKFVRSFGAVIDIKAFFERFWARLTDKKVKVPKAMEALFAEPGTDDERKVKVLIDEFNAQQATALEQELFKQVKRLADAERTLQTKATKAATESRRIAIDKIEWAKGKLADLRRTDIQEQDARMFPGWYVPVMISEGGQRVIKPMRYQCRPAGKPAFYDSKFPGTYNARRDSLRGFWRGLYGHSHGIMVVNAFYENVNREGTNVVLEFNPRPQQDMLVACLWSRWTGLDGEELLSFAAITDEPPAEIAAAGHDRCIIPIKPEHVDAWLNPDPKKLEVQDAILDDRERPYYEHRLAA